MTILIFAHVYYKNITDLTIHIWFELFSYSLNKRDSSNARIYDIRDFHNSFDTSHWRNKTNLPRRISHNINGDLHALTFADEYKNFSSPYKETNAQIKNRSDL